MSRANLSPWKNTLNARGVFAISSNPSATLKPSRISRPRLTTIGRRRCAILPPLSSPAMRGRMKEGVSNKDEIMMQNIFDFADDLGPIKIVHTYDPKSGLKAVVAIDNVARGPAIGGIRMAPDVSVEEAFRL